MAEAATLSIWPQLLPELAIRIANCMTANEVPCNLRLINKAAAALFRGPQHTTIHLSHPVPPHAFARRWAAPGATRGLPYRQRLNLLCLTAASGSIPNMEVALEAAGCQLTSQVFDAAAAAGQLEMCEWLLQRGCPFTGALCAAAKAGQRQACEWLLARTGVPVSMRADWAAARGGHVDLMEWLMRERPDAFSVPEERMERRCMLGDVAHGCDLATLQRLHHEWMEAWEGDQAHEEEQEEEEEDEEEEEFEDEDSTAVPLSAAACSPTPDWRAKVEWLEGRGYPRTARACILAAACPDAVERLAWLRGRGYPVNNEVTAAAAGAGNLAALQYLHAEGAPIGQNAVQQAAHGGHLSAVAWLVETPGVGGVELCSKLLNFAAWSGNLELMAWLREQGCRWDSFTFVKAAGGGNQAALEWLVERGCPFGELVEPFTQAAANNDTATLRCLLRLGCPWGHTGAVLRDAVDCAGARPAVVRELLAAGCPVEWETAEAVVRNSFRPDKAELLAVLAEERASRERQA